MKEFVKKPLAITAATALMLAFGGMANMAHATTILATQNISGVKTVKQGGAFKVEFSPSEKEIVSGQLSEDAPFFVLKMSDSARHTAWNIWPSGESKGGNLVAPDGKKLALYLTPKEKTFWGTQDHWYVGDAGSAPVILTFWLQKGNVLQAGDYSFTAKVDEILE
ncbi:TPA: MyfA/PsaA family fimbrial adhesin [Yersinia enterocolitica]|nr:MyfA/PsaA family fimbrial adhesin [Yersinia enterocolitica]